MMVHLYGTTARLAGPVHELGCIERKEGREYVSISILKRNISFFCTYCPTVSYQTETDRTLLNLLYRCRDIAVGRGIVIRPIIWYDLCLFSNRASYTGRCMLMEFPGRCRQGESERNRSCESAEEERKGRTQQKR